MEADIAERKRAEKAPRESEEQFRLLVESMKDYAIFMLDPSGRVVSWNLGAEQMKGYQAEEIVGRHFSQFYPSEDVANGKPERELNVAEVEGRCEDEGWRVRKNGSRFWASVVITAVRDQAGNLSGFAKVTRDMTERKRAEEALKRQREHLARSNAELVTTNKELDEFTHSVSDDLRAPLRQIDGFSKILMEEFGPRLEAQAHHYLQRIHEGVQQMAQLGETNDREIEWRIDELPVVNCDPNLMRLVFFNLLSNAIKYTRPKKSAVIRVGQTRMEGEPVIFIHDNGVGFDMKYVDKLFRIFQRLHSREDFEGTGVGLASVQRIIHKHGGRVWAEAEPDKGATFYFTLGVAEGSEAKSGVAMGERP